MSALTPRLFRSSIFIAVALALVSEAAGAGGRPRGYERVWFGDISMGRAFPQSDADDVLDDDWTISGGILFWPTDWPVGLRAELSYVKFDLSGEAINAINNAIDQDPMNSGQIDDGDIETWQLVLNGIWGPGSPDNGFYLFGGIGAYYLDATVTQTGLVYYPPICDPWYWWWWCFPGGVGPGSIIKGSDSTIELGWNLGLGYDYPLGDGELFIEANYQYLTTDSEDLYYLPVTVGYRW